MSDVSNILLVQSSVAYQSALETIASAIEILIACYRFRYGSYGAKLGMEFEGLALVSEEPIRRSVGVEQVDVVELKRLARDHDYVGTSGASEGFEADLFEDAGEVRRRDPAALVRFLADSRSATGSNGECGFLIGIRRSLLSDSEIEEVGSLWSWRNWVDTTNGFIVLSSLRAFRPLPE